MCLFLSVSGFAAVDWDFLSQAESSRQILDESGFSSLVAEDVQDEMGQVYVIENEEGLVTSQGFQLEVKGHTIWVDGRRLDDKMAVLVINELENGKDVYSNSILLYMISRTSPQIRQKIAPGIVFAFMRGGQAVYKYCTQPLTTVSCAKWVYGSKKYLEKLFGGD